MKKKIFTVLVTISLISGLAACAKNDNNANATPTTAPVTNDQNTTDPTVAPTTAPTEAPTVASIESPLALLQKVWDSYGEDERFAAAGGDFSAENSVMDAPGVYGMDNVEMLDSTFGISATNAAKIDSVASLMHMMNANTFTCGAFHLTDASEISAFSESLKNDVLNRQWMCGFPDILVIISVDDYVISVFGNEELVNTFKEKVTTVYPNATILADEFI